MKKTLVISLMLLVFLCISLLSVGWFSYKHLLSPVDSTDTTTKVFTVNSGETAQSIAEKLHQDKLIRNPLAFRMYAIRSGLAAKIQAGEFELSQTMSVPEITQTLTKAISKEVRVTLLEGWRREEMAAELENKLLLAGITFDKELFLSLPEIKEGYLFPDTYNFTLSTTETTVAKTLEANFNRRIASLRQDIEASPYTLEEVITMASIIEREARSDRAIVAGILWKRIENGWPLQADATLQYAKGYNRSTQEWWTPPLAADKDIESPYNSYKYQGLPPAPICNPSLSAIEAAVKPEETDYWFYITDLEGRMHYGVTLDDHNRNIDTYLR